MCVHLCMYVCMYMHVYTTETMKVCRMVVNTVEVIERPCGLQSRISSILHGSCTNKKWSSDFHPPPTLTMMRSLSICMMCNNMSYLVHCTSTGIIIYLKQTMMMSTFICLKCKTEVLHDTQLPIITRQCTYTLQCREFINYDIIQLLDSNH